MTLRALPTSRPARGRLLALLAAVLLLSGLAVPGLPQLGAVTASAATCPCSIFPSTAVPANPSDSDTAAVELGVKLRSDQNGFITGIRFYKGTGNTGTHTGSLWTTDGTRLATAIFGDETATGWQQVLFASPVAITAGTTYVASYYAPNGRYAGDTRAFATTGVDNAPLHALAEGVDGSNGVYRYGTGGGFPQNTWQSANYWVDVVFETSATDTTAPTLTARTPAPDSTGVLVGSQVTATFDEAVTGAKVALAGPSGAATGTTTYDPSSRTVTYAPQPALSPSTKYTVTVSGAVDAANNPMTATSWSFTTAATATGCPCSLWPTNPTPGTASAADNSAVELGVRFRSDVPGFVTGVRFYKGAANTGIHVGSLWRADGTQLATATFGPESATGWQSVSFASPVAISAATDYVASYHAPNGGYAADASGLSAARVSGPLRTPADSPATPNGVYTYGANAFPSSTYRSTNYWVDVVFDTTAADRTPPTVTATGPAAGATGVSTGTALTASFSEPVDPATLGFSLKTATGAAVTGATGYDAATRTATFTPEQVLANSATYTATVQASDTAGNPMAAPATWSFTTAAAAPADPALVGPVLVVAQEGTGFGRYLPEILKTEGLNSYETAAPASLTAATLAKYDAVVLAETALTASQVSTLTTWVNGGGNLVALRPDKQLAGLLGLTAVNGTLSDAYLKVDTTKAPGLGVTDVTMQFHGAADRYTLTAGAGATAVATLYSPVTTATVNPAVTLRSVGTSGGQAAAFTYDLARSVVLTRQGNPAWAGTERDGQTPIRSDDMFFGGRATDWVDLTRVAVPQADEQQRLLANVLQTVVRDRKPLPRFWYFPRMEKAVVVATGDDHGNNGTLGRYQQYEANSPAGCSVVLWSCLRFSSYVYPSTPLTAADARAYDTKGFETGVHPSSSCGNFTPASLDSIYSSQLGQWQTKYTGVPAPTTNRFHCIVYSDWASQPKTELKYGMGLDTNYYYWPGTWVADRPGFMTGSGMPMRFADTDGTVLGSYQAATQMTDESDQSYPFTPNTLLDNALGNLGYYGAFTANVHTDQATLYQNDQLVASARARGVPIVAARQLLTWLKGRDASRFTNLSWNAGSLSFGITAGAGADGLTALLPTAGPAGTLTGLTSAGKAVAFTKQTIKGLEYAVFAAAPGSYVASYGTTTTVTTAALRTAPADTTAGDPSTTGTTALTASPLAAPAPTSDAAVTGTDTAPADGTDGVYVRGNGSGAKQDRLSGSSAVAIGGATAAAPAVTATPVVSEVDVTSLPDGTAEVTWRTDVAADSEVVFGRSSAGLTQRRVDGDHVTEHVVVLTGLEPGATYRYAVRSTSRGGGTASGPERRFVQSAAGVADTTAASLRMGQRDAGGHVASRKDGEIQLSADEVADFDVPELPRGWVTEAEGGGRTVVYAGRMTVDGTRVLAPPRSGPRTLEFEATFAGTEQLVALATGIGGPGAGLRSRDGQLFATVGVGGGGETRLDQGLVGSPHRYRIAWDGTTAVVSVDGSEVARGSLRSTLPLRPVVRDVKGDEAPLTLEWLQESAYAAASTYVSRVLDAQQLVTWDRATWRADVPAGTSVRVSVRTGPRRTPDATWGDWATLSGPGGRVVGEGRYLQYRIELATTDASRTPVVRSFGVTHNGSLVRHEGEVR